MSWGAFKSAMASEMSNHKHGDSMDGFAAKLTKEYDKAVKAGKSNVTNIPLQRGQTSAMENLLKTHLRTQQKSKAQNLIAICGPAIIAYWTGAMLQSIPPGPPCPGTIQNVSVIVAPVLSPGSWTPQPSQPTDDVNKWLDVFIKCAKQHMNTVSGIHNQISLYPTSPSPTPAPCVQNWSGYKVPG